MSRKENAGGNACVEKPDEKGIQIFACTLGLLRGKPWKFKDLNPRKKEIDNSAWERITYLAEAIIKQSKEKGSFSMCKSWAQEIIMQCDILKER